MNTLQHFGQSTALPVIASGQLTVPLIEMELADNGGLSSQENRPKERVPRELALYSMLVGICIGSLLHLATLGGSFVILTSLGMEMSSPSARLIAFGLSFAISLVAITLNSAVRFLLRLALTSSTDITPTENDVAYVRLCNLLGLVTGIFAASVSTESLMDWDNSHFLLHTVALFAWVATSLVVTERGYAEVCSNTQELNERGCHPADCGCTDCCV